MPTKTNILAEIFLKRGFWAIFSDPPTGSASPGWPQSPPVTPVWQMLWAGSTGLVLQDKAVILTLYEVKKFKCVTSILYSVPFSKEQLSRLVLFSQASLLISSKKPLLVPGGQAHLRTKAGSLGTSSQWTVATGAASVSQAQHIVRFWDVHFCKHWLLGSSRTLAHLWGEDSHVVWQKRQRTLRLFPYPSCCK